MSTIDFKTDIGSLLKEENLLNLRKWQNDNMPAGKLDISKEEFRKLSNVFNAVNVLIGYVDDFCGGVAPDFVEPLTLSNVYRQVSEALDKLD